MKAQSRRALGWFLTGLGAPVFAAFLYPLMPRRRSPSLSNYMSDTGLIVLFLGAAFGAALLIVGMLLLWKREKANAKAIPLTGGALAAAGERPFLVCYDYGTGGLWWWITAPSAEDIIRTYREVEVFETPPVWWNPETDRLAKRLRLGQEAPGLSRRDPD